MVLDIDFLLDYVIPIETYYVEKTLIIAFAKLKKHVKCCVILCKTM